jgi:hypothetical protein
MKETQRRRIKVTSSSIEISKDNHLGNTVEGALLLPPPPLSSNLWPDI